MKTNLVLCGSLAVVAPINQLCAKPKAQPDKPNVVLIFADDHSFNALCNMTDGYLKTPNLDRLRKSGAYFTHAFNQGAWNGAVSAASRAMLNTGKYLWDAYSTDKQLGKAMARDQAIKKGTAPANLKEVEPVKLWGQMMREAGYTTYMAGKWHVRANAGKVFDHAVNIRGGMPKQTPSGYERTFVGDETHIWDPTDTTKGGYWAGGKHWSEVLKDDALNYIDMASKSDEPFFMYLAFNAPHDPRQSPQEYLDMYDEKEIEVPTNFMPIYPYCEEVGAGRKLRDEKLAPFPRNERSVRMNRQEYYALITHLDTQIGIILDALEASGKMDNTYIMYSADHGLSVGDHGFLGKQNMYDAAVRVPLFIAGPSIKKGTKIDNMVYLQDMMATALDLAGSPEVEHVDFQSLLPLVHKQTKESREVIYGAYIKYQRMIRTDNYKMLIYPEANVVRLFDLKKDPAEAHDLASDPKYKATMDDLFAQFKELQVLHKDKLSVDEAYHAFFSNL